MAHTLVLDTDITSRIWRNDLTPHLERQLTDALPFITFVTLAEALRGAHLARWGSTRTGALRAFYAHPGLPAELLLGEPRVAPGGAQSLAERAGLWLTPHLRQPLPVVDAFARLGLVQVQRKFGRVRDGHARRITAACDDLMTRWRSSRVSSVGKRRWAAALGGTGRRARRAEFSDPAGSAAWVLPVLPLGRPGFGVRWIRVQVTAVQPGPAPG